MAADLNLTMYRGERKTIDVTDVIDENGNPVTVNTATVYFHAKVDINDDDADAIIALNTVDDPLAITFPASDAIRIVINEDLTEDLTESIELVAAVNVVLADGSPFVVAYGTLDIALNPKMAIG